MRIIITEEKMEITELLFFVLCSCRDLSNNSIQAVMKHNFASLNSLLHLEPNHTCVV